MPCPTFADRLLSPLLRLTAPSVALGIVVAVSFLVVETLLIVLLERGDPNDTYGMLYLPGVPV